MRSFIDGKGDIPDIIDRFKSRKQENLEDRKGKCFFITAEEIVENNYDLSISRYKEIEYEEVQYEKPEVILDQLDALEDEIKKNIAELRALLAGKGGQE